MKFGKQFEFYKIPEWSEFYFDYNGVKTILKFIDSRRDKKKQIKKLKKLKKKLRKFSAQLNSNTNDLLNNKDENINIKLVINSKEEEEPNIIKEKDIETDNDNEKEKENEKVNLSEPMLNQKFNDDDSKNELKPFLEGEKVNEHFYTKTEKIMEAEDLSDLPNDQKLEKFLKIYKEKLSFINEFFLKKIEEFEEK